MCRPTALLVLLGAAASAQQVPEGPEPNHSPATATPLPLGREAQGVLAGAGDSDWYRVVLTAPTDLRLETGPGPGSEAGDTALLLLDAAGSPLRGNAQGVGCGLYAHLAAPALPAGTYLVAVEAGPASSGGSYTLDVRAAAPASLPAPPVVAEGPENNDPRSGGTATAVSLPARCSGLVSSTGAGGDWDFWRFLLFADSFVQVRMAATPQHANPPVLDDPVLYLFDGSSPPNRVAGPFHASDFGRWDAPLDLRLPAGSWQVAVRGWVASPAGRYYLDLHRSDAARVTVHAGGCGGRALAVATTGVGPGAPLRIERPAIGTTFALRGSNLGAGGFALHVVGFAATWLDLSPLGAPGCALEVSFVDTPLQLADAAGEATFVVAVPETPSLAGVVLESQVAVFDLSNPLGFTLSNRVSAVVGP